MKWLDGSRFEGEWKDDKRLKGKMYMIDGTVYEGSFHNDQFHGKGSITMRAVGRNAEGKENKKTFTGVFHHGKVPNRGKIEYHSNGDVYYGEHLDYERNGFGHCFFKSGLMYQGMWQDDKREGVGIALASNGNYYHGEFINGKKEGVGRHYTKSDETIYEGGWGKDERNGEGYLIEPKKGEIIKGYWRQGKIDGKTTVLRMEDLGQVRVLEEKGIKAALDLKNVFKLPDDLKDL